MKAKFSQEVKYDSVLLIDEDDIDNFINERMITTSNFAKRVIVKTSAISALEYLKEITSPESYPKIIFLDLNMPVMDGFGFLEEFDKLAKQNPALAETSKIIVLSSSISPADINKASTNPYVIKYLNKPLSEKYLDAIS
jgi:CheY-like chemotaxis protein